MVSASSARPDSHYSREADRIAVRQAAEQYSVEYRRIGGQGPARADNALLARAGPSSAERAPQAGGIRQAHE